MLAEQLVAVLGAERAADLFPINVNPDRRLVPAQPVVLAATGSAAGLGRWHELPLSLPEFGSNNWAIAGQRSASGKPIVVNDPHVDVRVLPGLWHPIALFAPGYRAAGLALPGLPGIFVGRSGSVAFGVTNAYPDVQDLYVERVNPDDPGQYWSQTGWRQFERIEQTLRIADEDAAGGYREEAFTLRLTERGPIISDHLPAFAAARETRGENYAVSLRWAAAQTHSRTIGLDALMNATDSAAVEAAIADMDVMQFNWVFADVAGNIGRRASGAVPTRTPGNGVLPQAVTPDDSWTGYIPKSLLPGEFNPARGWTGTANHDTRPDNYPYYYSSYFASSYRYRRLQQLLEQAAVMGTKQQWKFMQDVTNLQAQRTLPAVLSALVDRPQHAQAAALLGAWDGVESGDSAATLLYHNFMHHLLRGVLVDDLGSALTADYLRARYFWQERFDLLVTHPDAWVFDDASTPARETLPDLIRGAMTQAVDELQSSYGDAWNRTRWDTAHTLKFLSPLRREGRGARLLGGGVWPLDGSSETLKRAGYAGTSTVDGRFDVNFFASARVVVDLGDSGKIQAVVPGGVVGRQFHPHQTDLIPVWHAGENIALWIDPVLAEQHSVATLRLQPRSSGR